MTRAGIFAALADRTQLANVDRLRHSHAASASRGNTKPQTDEIVQAADVAITVRPIRDDIENLR